MKLSQEEYEKKAQENLTRIKHEYDNNICAGCSQKILIKTDTEVVVLLVHKGKTTGMMRTHGPICLGRIALSLIKANNDARKYEEENNLV